MCVACEGRLAEVWIDSGRMDAMRSLAPTACVYFLLALVLTIGSELHVLRQR
jgi:hypothetical protein